MNRNINRAASILSAVFMLGVALPAGADETGMGKPQSTTNAMTLSTDCGYFETLLGLCESAETSDETASESETQE